MATKLTRSLWGASPFKGIIVSTFVLDIFTALAVFLLRGFLPPVVPLFYGRPLGEAQLVPALGLIIAPTLSFAIAVLNISLSFFVEQNLNKKIFIISAFLISLLSTITVLKIVLLVGFF